MVKYSVSSTDGCNLIEACIKKPLGAYCLVRIDQTRVGDPERIATNENTTLVGWEAGSQLGRMQ